MEACTVTALDAITAFAVPNPNCSSQESVGFFGASDQSLATSSRGLPAQYFLSFCFSMTSDLPPLTWRFPQRRARKVAVVPLIAISRIPGGNHHGGRRDSRRTCVAFVGCC